MNEQIKEAFNVLNKLEESGFARNIKIEILEEYKNNPILQEIFRLTYDWETTFGISPPKKLQRLSSNRFVDLNAEWNNFVWMCEKFSTRSLTGNYAREELNDFLSLVDAERVEWYRRIINRDLKVRITNTTIKKIWPKLIKQFDVQLADSVEDLNKSISFPSYIEPKYDGMRAVLVINNGKGTMYSRSGHELPNVQFIADSIAKDTKEDCVIDGELFGNNWNDTIKYVKTTKNLTSSLEKKLKEIIVYYAFDYLSYEEFSNKKCKTNLETRKENLSNWYNNLLEPENIKLVPFVLSHSPSKTQQIYDDYLKKFFEGIMIKNPKSLYKFKRTKDWLKHKPFITIDCKILGYRRGEENSRLENTMGSLLVEYNNETFDVGSGMTDQIREKLWNEREELIGKYVEVKINKDLGDKISVVNFPVFIRMRIDKD